MAVSLDSTSRIRFLRISEFHCNINPLAFEVEPANGYEIKSSDWVGLFMVGWSGIDNFVAKQAVSLPGSLTFSVESFPRDCSNFYQLCYFDSSNDLLGISSTFSFIAEDNSFVTDCSGDGVLVDVNDTDNDEIVLVKTSRNQLEIALAKTMKEKLQLEKVVAEQKEAIARLGEKVEVLSAKFDRCKFELEEEKEKFSAIVEEQTKACQRVETLEKEAQEKQTLVNQLTASLEKETDNNAGYSVLNADNERLLKRVQELEHQVACHLNDFDRVKEQFSNSDKLRVQLVNENQELSGRVRELNNRLLEQQQITERLEETLRNAEERLLINDDLKRMLQQEVDSLMAVQRSLAVRLEDSKSDAHSAKSNVAKLEKDLEAKHRTCLTLEERNTELEQSRSDAVLKFYNQKSLTEAAEKQVSELKLRLEKGAEEYRVLYRQAHRRDGPGANLRSSSPASESLPRGNRQDSLPPSVKCPLCDLLIASSEIQNHFQAHDEQQSSGELALPQCPVCNERYAVVDIQSHVESHFD